MVKFHKKTDENGVEFNSVQHIIVPATDILKTELLVSYKETKYYIYERGKLLCEPVGLDTELQGLMDSLGYKLKPHTIEKTMGRKSLCGYTVSIDQKIKGYIHIRFSGTDAIDSREKFVAIAKYLKKCDPSIKLRCRESAKVNCNTKGVR